MNNSPLSGALAARFPDIAQAPDSPPATVLIIPGLRDHVDDHWQTWLHARLEAARPGSVVSVPPLQENGLSLSARVDAIQAQFASISGPVILVAHSAGVLMAVHWAARHAKEAGRRVRGALLATPPDVGAQWPAKYPSPDSLREHGWLPAPTVPLPFPCIVAASSNDPLATEQAVSAMAETWGAVLLELGEVGHLNPGSGYGPWPPAEELVAMLQAM